METCGHPHPDQDTLSCDKSPHPYGAHMHWASRTTWSGVNPPAKVGKGKKQRAEELAQIAAQVQQTNTPVGSPTSIRREAQDRAHTAWKRDRDQWLAQASEVLHQVCLTEPEFTLEKVWAKLPDTPERRIMAVVTKKAVRDGWMHEVRGVRINHEWRTADGASFLLGKFTPVYASDLLGGVLQDGVPKTHLLD